MKKLFIILVILIIAGAFGIYYFTRNDSVNINPTNTTTTSKKPDPSNASFVFDEESMTFTNGKFFNTSGTEANILPEKAYGDLNGDGKDDVILLVSQTGGGSGVFIYAAAYVSGTINYKGTNAIFLGDRVSPQNVSIANGIATVKYLDRKDNEPFAAEPTVPKTLQLVYKNGTLLEK